MRARLSLLSPLLFMIPYSFADSGLSQNELTMLQDPGGWEYTSVFDTNSGVAEQHSCFSEGHANPDACQGTMTFNSDGTFKSTILIHGGSYSRHGTYQLSSNQITFADELGTTDGPYTLVIKTDAKTMKMSMNPNGVLIGSEFLLEKEYRRRQAAKSQGQ